MSERSELSVKQAAERLDTSIANVYRLITEGVLPARRLAPRGRLRIRAGDLERCVVETGGPVSQPRAGAGRGQSVAPADNPAPALSPGAA